MVLPPAVRNADWPQAGGNPAHLMGHLAANDNLAEAWKADIGEGGGYRQVIMAQPVVLDGTVFTMDSDAVVSAFAMADGKRLWRVDTKPKDDGRQHQCRRAASERTAPRSMPSTGCSRWWRWTRRPARRSGGRIWVRRLGRRR